MDRLRELIVDFLPLLATAAVVVLSLMAMNWLLVRRFPQLGGDRKLPRQLILLGLGLAGAVAIALALPVSESTRNQLIALIGVLLSAVIAFSATSIIGNFMAGLMLRSTRSFRVGDFIKVEEHFGRVAERGLFDTEIQTEHRELISLPNAYLISHPVTALRSSGAIVSATLSLGYDLHHGQIESLLISAAQETGLTEPFVQITELGNYAITYRVSGLLTDVKSILTTRSNLHRMILDTLHSNGIEIVSPTFMNQRRLDERTKIVPRQVVEASSTTAFSPEEIVFDKAEEAEVREEAKVRLQGELQRLEKTKGSSGEDKQRLADLIAQKREQLADLENTDQRAK